MRIHDRIISEQGEVSGRWAKKTFCTSRRENFLKSRTNVRLALNQRFE